MEENVFTFLKPAVRLFEPFMLLFIALGPSVITYLKFGGLEIESVQKSPYYSKDGTFTFQSMLP